MNKTKIASRKKTSPNNTNKHNYNHRTYKPLARIMCAHNDSKNAKAKQYKIMQYSPRSLNLPSTQTNKSKIQTDKNKPRDPNKQQSQQTLAQDPLQQLPKITYKPKRIKKRKSRTRTTTTTDNTDNLISAFKAVIPNHKYNTRSTTTNQLRKYESNPHCQNLKPICPHTYVQPI